MTGLRFLDTNILLYSISRDPTETTKHDRAVGLIDAGNNALSVAGVQRSGDPANPARSVATRYRSRAYPHVVAL
jgi:predicted nucleic acid-binding protein